MVENEVNEGNVEANSSNAAEVKTEQPNEAAQDAVENTETAPATEPEVEATPAPAPMGPDEKILSDMFDSGKEEVTTSELITSGFDTTLIGQYEFSVGKFKLTRLLLVSPYKIEKQA